MTSLVILCPLQPYLFDIPCAEGVKIVLTKVCVCVCGTLQVLLKVHAGDDEQHALFYHTGSLDPVDHFSSEVDDSEG